MWRCFWLEQTGRETRRLRRYHPRDRHEPGEHLHEAHVRIADGPIRTSPDGYHRSDAAGFERDPAWPAGCGCGYQFAEHDTWQVLGDPIYARLDGAWWPMRDIPIGGMIHAWWMPGPAWRGADDLSAMVKLPPGGRHDWWMIDGPSSGGGRWTRTGTVPDLTVSPSILTPAYHGWLGTGGAPVGWLSDPL